MTVKVQCIAPSEGIPHLHCCIATARVFASNGKIPPIGRPGHSTDGIKARIGHREERILRKLACGHIPDLYRVSKTTQQGQILAIGWPHRSRSHYTLVCSIGEDDGS